MLTKILGLVLVLQLVDSAFGCGGYKMRVLSKENCANPIVTNFETDTSFTLEDTCELVPVGCYTTKGFSSSKLKISLRKNSRVITEEPFDFCETGGCTLTGRLCPNHAVLDLYDIRILLFQYSSPIQIQIMGQHDTGKTCLKFDVEFYRA